MWAGGIGVAVSLFAMPLAAQSGSSKAPSPLAVLAPVTFTSTSAENVFVVVSANDGVKDLTLRLNDGPSVMPRRSDRNIHHFRTRLAIGPNVIRVIGSTGNTTVAEELAIFRLAKVGMRAVAPFPKYYFHTDLFEKRCKSCHETAPETASEKDPTVKSVCLKCHTPLVSEKFVHGPIAVGTCSICHNLSSEPNRYQLKQASFDLCLLCHTKTAEALKTSKFTHGPLGAALCDVCHEPHSSPNLASLRQPSGEICMVCHKTLESLYQTRTYLHIPFKQRMCCKCHDPHYSDENFLLKKTDDQICRSCHQEAMEEHTHPVGVIPKRKLPFEARYGEGGELLCVTCHNPHASEGEHLLPKEGCSACHMM
ncbi:hypothetical protein HZA56_13710 [Candidatus Poribacteria bacterium]|nr:hypothetical protein [Candidatus Poribacteria bacterium]